MKKIWVLAFVSSFGLSISAVFAQDYFAAEYDLANQQYEFVDEEVDTLPWPLHSFPVPRGYISGLQMSNLDGNAISITAGVARSIDNKRNITLLEGRTVVKSLDEQWAPHSTGGRPSGVLLEPNTTYHVFVLGSKIREGQYTDAGFDTSIDAENLMADAKLKGFKYYRRIGSLYTDANSRLVRFHQEGEYFWLDNPLLTVEDAPPVLGATWHVLPHIPIGLKLKAMISFTLAIYTNSGPMRLIVLNPHQDVVAHLHYGMYDLRTSTQSNVNSSRLHVQTDETGQMGYYLYEEENNPGNTAWVKGLLHGWIDSRDKD